MRLGPLAIEWGGLQYKVGPFWLRDGLHLWWGDRGVHLYWHKHRTQRRIVFDRLER